MQVPLGGRAVGQNRLQRVLRVSTQVRELEQEGGVVKRQGGFAFYECICIIHTKTRAGGLTQLSFTRIGMHHLHWMMLYRGALLRWYAGRTMMNRLQYRDGIY